MSFERHFEVSYVRKGSTALYAIEHDGEQEAFADFHRLANDPEIKTVEMVEVIRLKRGSAAKA